MDRSLTAAVSELQVVLPDRFMVIYLTALERVITLE